MQEKNSFYQVNIKVKYVQTKEGIQFGKTFDVGGIIDDMSMDYINKMIDLTIKEIKKADTDYFVHYVMDITELNYYNDMPDVVIDSLYLHLEKNRKDEEIEDIKKATLEKIATIKNSL